MERIHTDNFEMRFAQLGAAGWEMCGAFPEGLKGCFFFKKEVPL